VPPAEWRRHDVLGEWLAETTGETPVAAAEPATALDALVELQLVEQERREAEARLESGRNAAKHAFAVRAAAALAGLEETMDAYAQLWLGLSRLGIAQVAPLGTVLDAGDLDPVRHEIVGEQGARSYVVRSAGIEIDGEVVRRARVESQG
jgi:hypothetical protein